LAAQVVAKAEAYKAEKINRSEGEALRFEAQLAEYKKAPEITKKRLYLEMMENVLSQIDMVIIDPKVAKSALPLLNLTPGRNVEIKGGN
jgi:membrane protease subunit HflK